MKPNPRDPTTGAVMESPSRLSANVGRGISSAVVNQPPNPPLQPTPLTRRG